MIETTRRHIFLAGFMGTGKTTIGRIVANRLGCGFIDLDAFIESMCHRRVRDIFRVEGEPVFRDYEARALRLASVSPHSVIALGGGTPLRRANAHVIRATGRTWLLTATLEAIWLRVRDGIESRPLIAGSAGARKGSDLTFEEFASIARPLLESRRPAYDAIASFTIDTSRDPADSVAARIVEQFHAGAVSVSAT